MSSSNIRADQIAGMAQEIAKEIERVLRSATRCCPRCENFDREREVCKADVMKRRPPANVIAFGCPAFEEEIPF